MLYNGWIGYPRFTDIQRALAWHRRGIPKHIYYDSIKSQLI